MDNGHTLPSIGTYFRPLVNPQEAFDNRDIGAIWDGKEMIRGDIMYFYRDIYCSETVQDKKKRILRKLRMNAGQLKVYTVSLASGNDLFEIMHCANFKQRYYDRSRLYIIGIASSYTEAIQLTETMILDFYQKYGTYHFKEYLLENSKDWY